MSETDERLSEIARRALDGGGDSEPGAPDTEHRHEMLATLPPDLCNVVEPVVNGPAVSGRVSGAEAIRGSDAWLRAPAAVRVLVADLLKTFGDNSGGTERFVPVPKGVQAAIDATIGRLDRTGIWLESRSVEMPSAEPFDVELEVLPKLTEPRKWLVKNLIPHGRLSAIYGAGEIGKSRFVLQLAAGVITGQGVMIARDPKATDAHSLAVLGDIPTIQQQGKVLLLTWEDEPDEVARRWQMAHAAGAIEQKHPGDDLQVLNMRAIGSGKALWSPHATGSRHVSTEGEWTATGRRVLATLSRFTLTVIDPLAAAYACSEVDRSLVRAFTAALDQSAEEAGCTVLLVGHPPKSGESYSGSTDWFNSFRGMLTLGPQPTGYRPPGKTDKGNNHPIITAPRLTREKGSYGPDVDNLWLRSEWTPAAHDAGPARLAWFVTTAARAAKAIHGAPVVSVAEEGKANASLGLGTPK